MDRVSAGLGLAWGGGGKLLFYSSYDIIVLGGDCGGGGLDMLGLFIHIPQVLVLLHQGPI